MYTDLEFISICTLLFIENWINFQPTGLLENLLHSCAHLRKVGLMNGTRAK